MKKISRSNLSLSVTTREGTPQHADKKLREMMLYICKRCEGDPKFGATKLNKILWFADFYSYRMRKKSITGAEYQKLQFGPAPKKLIPAKKKLEEDGRLVEIKESKFGMNQRRMIAVNDPDLKEFDADDIAMVDLAISYLAGYNNAQVSDLSHGIIWRASILNELIPYEAAFVEERPITEADRQRVFQLASQYEW